MQSINIYLTFDGQTEAAFNFYKSIFGGDFVMMSRFGEMPAEANGGEPMSADTAQRIMHISYKLPNGQSLMASDTMPGVHTVLMGNNFSISINGSSEEEIVRYFNGLSEGGQVTMPLEKTFWNAYFGMCTDKFGIQWMVNYDYPQS